MDIELKYDYPNPDYPVAVNFWERKKEDAAQSDWVVRSEEAEVLVVNNGELRVTCDDGLHSVFAGQGVLLTPGSRHKLSSSSTEDTAFYSVVFRPDFAIDTSLDNDIAARFFGPVRDRFRNTCLVMDEANLRDESALDRINDIIAANTIKKFGYEMATKGYICMLWVLLLDFYGRVEAPFNGRNVPSQDELRVKSAIAYMEESYADPITLEDIADRIHVSRNECCRCFKRVMAVSPVDFLIRLRIFQAAKILYKDPLSVDSISELGFRTGFNNTSYFNRMFKRYLECTPREFSKMLKTDPDKAKKIFDSLQESVTGI